MPPKHRRKLEIEDVGDITRVIFLDRIIADEQNIQIISELLFSLVDKQEKKKIVLDFKDVDYLSTVVFGKLITLQKKVNVAGGKLVLCSIAPEISDVFEMTKLDKLFSIAKNEEETKELIK